MTNKPNSKRRGVLKDGTTDIQRDTRSTNAESPFISDTSASTPLQNPTFQPTPNSQGIHPNVQQARIIHAFADKLGKAGLVEWRKVVLKNGKEAYALCFLTDHWLVDPITHELTLL